MIDFFSRIHVSKPKKVHHTRKQLRYLIQRSNINLFGKKKNFERNANNITEIVIFYVILLIRSIQLSLVKIINLWKVRSLGETRKRGTGRASRRGKLHAWAVFLCTRAHDDPRSSLLSSVVVSLTLEKCSTKSSCEKRVSVSLHLIFIPKYLVCILYLMRT